MRWFRPRTLVVTVTTVREEGRSPVPAEPGTRAADADPVRLGPEARQARSGRGPTAPPARDHAGAFARTAGDSEPGYS
jgi:hypothetical protein